MYDKVLSFVLQVFENAFPFTSNSEQASHSSSFMSSQCDGVLNQTEEVRNIYNMSHTSSEAVVLAGNSEVILQAVYWIT